MKIPAREFAGHTLGIEMVLSLLLPGWAGRSIDQHFHTDPTFLLLGVGLGFAAGIRQIYRTMKRLDAQSATEASKKL
jgi:F0F1-type ATP synthase assembly protein I